ncbi:hypothetical protein GCM10020001_011150 [Nonomuraea salmonea]
MPLGSLRPSPLVEQATEHLREQITQGEWPVGTRLPGENTLAKTLGGWGARPCARRCGRSPAPGWCRRGRGPVST